MNQSLVEQAKALIVSGLSQRTIATQLNIPRSTLGDWLRADKPKEKIVGGPRILILDIENSPSRAYVWQRWKNNVGQNQVISEAYLLTYAAKWLGEDLVISGRIDQQLDEGFEDDKRIVEELANLLNQADIVVAHNGKKHDFSLINTRMLFHGMTPPSPYRMLDTLELAKQVFKFPSNSLDSICAYLGLSRKIDTGGFELWSRCMDGDDEAFEEMLEYNIQDVFILEEAYLKLRAWWPKHPSVAPYYNDGKAHCPCCGSTSIVEDSMAYTNLSQFASYVCSDCGKVSRGKKNMRTKESMQTTLMNVL